MKDRNELCVTGPLNLLLINVSVHAARPNDPFMACEKLCIYLIC